LGDWKPLHDSMQDFLRRRAGGGSVGLFHGFSVRRTHHLDKSPPLNTHFNFTDGISIKKWILCADKLERTVFLERTWNDWFFTDKCPEILYPIRYFDNNTCAISLSVSHCPTINSVGVFSTFRVQAHNGVKLYGRAAEEICWRGNCFRSYVMVSWENIPAITLPYIRLCIWQKKRHLPAFWHYSVLLPW